MPNFDATSLAAGTTISGAVGSTQPAVIVSQQQPNQGTICRIDPTNAVSLDLTKLQNCSGQVIQYTFANNSEATATLIWCGVAAHNDHVMGSDLYPGLTTAAWANEVATVTESSLPVTAYVGGLRRSDELFGDDGALFSNFTIQVNTGGANGAANVAFANNPLITFVIPANPADSYNKNTNYPDFCDCCYTTNNGNFTTKCYDMPLTMSQRTGFMIDIPATATGIIRLTFAGLSIPNNEFIGGNFSVGA